MPLLMLGKRSFLFQTLSEDIVECEERLVVMIIKVIIFFMRVKIIQMNSNILFLILLMVKQFYITKSCKGFCSFVRSDLQSD